MGLKNGRKRGTNRITWVKPWSCCIRILVVSRTPWTGRFTTNVSAWWLEQAYLHEKIKRQPENFKMVGSETAENLSKQRIALPTTIAS